MTYCSNCGVKLFDGSKFCANCGTQSVIKAQEGSTNKQTERKNVTN